MGGYRGGYGSPGAAYRNPFEDPEYYGKVKDKIILDAEGGRPGFGLFAGAYGGSSEFQDWLHNQERRQRTNYLGQAAIDPTLQWFDYLKKWNAGQEYRNLSPFARGERSQTYATPYVKYTTGR